MSRNPNIGAKDGFAGISDDHQLLVLRWHCSHPEGKTLRATSRNYGEPKSNRVRLFFGSVNRAPYRFK